LNVEPLRPQGLRDLRWVIRARVMKRCDNQYGHERDDRDGGDDYSTPTHVASLSRPADWPMLPSPTRQLVEP
jgi:hypothetical protein